MIFRTIDASKHECRSLVAGTHEIYSSRFDDGLIGLSAFTRAPRDQFSEQHPTTTVEIRMTSREAADLIAKLAVVVAGHDKP